MFTLSVCEFTIVLRFTINFTISIFCFYEKSGENLENQKIRKSKEKIAVFDIFELIPALGIDL